MIRNDANDRVFEWLAEGLSPSPPVYLHLLGPGGGERREQVVANLKIVAGRLRERPDYWGELIRARNWRHTLVGCSAVLSARDRRFLGDLLDRFKRGSWVAPQLAVALGLIHPAEASGELEALMRQEDPADPKSIFSAYAVLKLLSHQAAEAFEASEQFYQAQHGTPGTSTSTSDGSVVVRTVHRQWDFWKDKGHFDSFINKI